MSKEYFLSCAFPVTQLWKIVQTWKIKLILVCYFCNILNLQEWGVKFPFLLDRHFIRLLWICFPVEEKTFCKYSYLLQLIITITTIYIINKWFSQKMFYSKHLTVTRRCQFEGLLVKNVCSGISMAYRFLRSKNRRSSEMWDVGFRKSLKQATRSLK